jgi:hypothetical protein
MSTSFVDEYLVKLGTSVDASGMQRFFQALKQATTVSESSATAIAGAFFKAQTEITGGFLAIGTAALGMIDKVAMADQSYRLFALHMYMSKDVARGLKTAMDALGASLEDITWDKELRGRAKQLMEDQRAMAPDGDFDSQMKKVRDIRFEFTRMEVEGQYLAMNVVNTFMKALGFGPDTLLEKLQRFNTWVTHNMPEIASKVVSVFMPVWQDLKEVFAATSGAVKETALAFTNLIGIFDHSVGGNTFSLEKFGKALADIIHLFATFVEAIANVEEMLAHLVSAIALVASGNFSGAGTELKAAFHSVTASAVGGVVGGGAGGWAAGAATGALAGSVFGPVGTAIGAGIGATGGALGGAFIGSNIGRTLGAPSGGGGSTGTAANSDLHAMIDHYAQQLGVDPYLAHAIARTESGERQYDASGNLVTSSTGAIGTMQLTRHTAAALGVDRNDTGGNIRGGITLLAQLLKHYNGNVAEAVGGYHEGQAKMDAVLSGRATLSTEARGEIAKVMGQMGAKGDVHVGSIVIHIDKPGHTNEQVASVVVAKLNTIRDKRVQRNLSELQDSSWSY